EWTSEWTSVQHVEVGNWLLNCAYCFDFFYRNADGLPEIAEEYRAVIDQLHVDLMLLDPVYMPHLKEPQDWTGWRKHYPDRLRAKFVRDWRTETKEAITEAFKDPEWEHPKGLNALKRVPYKINTRMLPLVDEFAVKLMGHWDDEKRQNDKRTVANDLSVAK